MRADVLILTGAPGAGKTTVAAELAERFEKSVHIESDVFFHFLVRGHVEPWKAEAQPQNEMVFRAVAASTAAYAKAGYFTIVEGIVGPDSFFRPLARAIVAETFSVAYAVLQVPLDVALGRARARARLHRSPVIEHLWNAFSDLGPLDRHGVAVGDMSAQDIAAELLKLLSDTDRLLVRPAELNDPASR